MKITILTNNRESRGPGMVYKNLTKGLNRIGVETTQYPLTLPLEGDYHVCLSDPAPWEAQGVEPKTLSLIGPNNWTLPDEKTAKKYNNFLVPSQWVKDLYLSFDFMKDKNLHIWPVGIDTEDWPDQSKANKRGDCLVYHKGMPDSLKNIAIELCLDKGLSCGVLEYGSYAESALHEAVQACRFAILTTRTESQGIAYLQILASGLPCFVFEKEKWDDMEGVNFPASSVPYWDERCGVKVQEGASREEIYEAFSYFLENLDSFDPRAYVEENLTLESSAQKFIEILESTNG